MQSDMRGWLAGELKPTEIEESFGTASVRRGQSYPGRKNWIARMSLIGSVACRRDRDCCAGVIALPSIRPGTIPGFTPCPVSNFDTDHTAASVLPPRWGRFSV